jgi:hypothetical protein
MNCHHHDWLVNSASSRHSRGNRALTEIVIHHDANESLSTAYADDDLEPIVTAEERRRRQRQLAMAKAEAVTSRYSYLCGGSTSKRPTSTDTRSIQRNSAQSRQLRTSAASVTSNNSNRSSSRRGSIEPDYLFTSKPLRKKSSSSTSASSACGEKDGEVPPPPPPLKTEVTSVILASQGEREQTSDGDEATATNPPQFVAEVTDKVSNPPLKSPARMRSRMGDSSTQDQESLPSLQEMPPKAARPLPRSRSRNLIDLHRIMNEQELEWQGTRAGRTVEAPLQTTDASNRRILASEAVEEQARWLQELNNRNNSSFAAAANREDVNSHSATWPLLPLEEQARLWEDLRSSRRSFGSMSSSNSGSSIIAPPAQSVISPLLEDQARLLEQFRKNSSSAPSIGNAVAPSGSMSPASPIEEQALLFAQIQKSRAPRLMTAVEEQEEMLRALTLRNREIAAVDTASGLATSHKAVVSPIEEQALLLKEIQQEEEKQMMEAACRFSMEDSIASLTQASGTSVGNEEEELSLRHIMELSRREAEAEAEARDKAQHEVDRALEIALERSKEDLGGVTGENEARDFQEMRLSIAELACQSSDRTLGNRTASSSGSTHRPWGVFSKR